MNANEAIKFLKGVRIFVTSRERIKHPEGTDLFDKAIAALEAPPTSASDAEPPALPAHVGEYHVECLGVQELYTSYQMHDFYRQGYEAALTRSPARVGGESP